LVEFECKTIVPPAALVSRLDPKFNGEASDSDIATRRLALAVELTVAFD
jgi:hypothetical protein